MHEKLPASGKHISRRALLFGGIATAAAAGTAAGLFERHAIWGLLTSSGGPYLNPNWVPLSAHKVDANMEWVRFQGDPSVKGKWQRDWHKIGILATDAVDLRKLQAEYPGGVESVAFADPGGHVQAAFDADDQPFFAVSRDGGLLVAGARIGSGELQAAQGLYLPRLGSFVMAKTVAAGITDTAHMQQVAPGAYYV